MKQKNNFRRRMLVLMTSLIFIAGAFIPAVGMPVESPVLRLLGQPLLPGAADPEELKAITDTEHSYDSKSNDFLEGNRPGPLNINDPWWNSGSNWLYRKPITIDRTKVVTGPHYNFPVLISLPSDADLASKAQSDGDDIVFVNNATGTKLNHEIELFESTTGKLIAWVNVSSLSSTANTVLYLYYGNPSCTNQENPSGVWNSSFVMVQHLNETSGTCNDSTSHNNDGTPVGVFNRNAVGIIDGADSFNGINSTYFVHDTGSLAGFTTGLTLSAWVKFNNITARQGFFGKWATGSIARSYLFEYQLHATHGKVLLFAGTSAASGTPQTYTYSTFTPTVGVWYHVAAVWTPNQYAKLYVNGVLATVKTQGTYISSIYNNILDPLFIGSYANNSRILNGSIDEARVTKIARPVGWLTTEYNNQNNPNTFYSVGPEEINPQYPRITNPSPTNGSINVRISLSEINFAINCLHTMNYTVSMIPDVISGPQTGNNVVNTTIHIPITGGPLEYNTTYTWQVHVNNGTYWTNKTFSFTTEVEPGLWWNTGWSYRKNITIDYTKVQGTQNNFPVLINLTDLNLSTKAQPDGDDIVFTDCYGNQLNHEIEYYYSISGKLVAWVNVPSLSSTANTVLYLYYGNPSCSNQENPVGVWNSSFVMVQHLNETSGTCNDSTSHNNDGTPVGVFNRNAVGKIDGADGFNGVNSTYFVPDKGSLAGFTKGLTLSAWVKFNNITARQGFINKWASNGIARAYLFEYQVHATYGKVFLFDVTDNAAGSNENYLFSTFTPTIGVWYHVAAVWTPDQLAKTYVNGVLATVKAQNPSTISSIYNNTLDPLLIGAFYNNSRILNGSIDEARVSNIARSVDWLNTEYNNQNNPNTFYSVGPEEPQPYCPIVKNPAPQNDAANVPVALSELSFDLIDNENDLMNYSVTIDPDVISGPQSDTDVVNGTTVHIPITSGPLDFNTIYTWEVKVTDGTHWTNKTFSFRTRPNYAYPPTSFKATTINRTQINLTWTPDTIADTTYIEQNSVASWNIEEGTMIYNNTGTGYNHIGLLKGTTYYYQAWSYNDTYHTYGPTSASANATTIPTLPPTLSHPNPPTGSKGISLRPICSIMVDDNTDDPLDICFFSSDDNTSWVFEQKNASISTIGGAVNLIWNNYSRATNYSTKYYWKVTVDNGTINVTYYYSFSTKEGDYDFAIIAYSDWYKYRGEWDLQRLADWHNTNDTLRTYIINVSNITNNPAYWVNGTWGDANPSNPYRRLDEASVTKYSMFNDTQAKIRNYIRYANHELGVTYVLLVGDNDTLPVRCFFGWGLGIDRYNANIPADMYYGCLNGTFNDDQDLYVPGVSGWAEGPDRNSHGIDESDWRFEVAIGRFPAHNVSELSNNVRKTIVYMSQDGTEDYLYNITLAAGYCGWGTITDGIGFSIQLKGAICTSGVITTHGFDPDIYAFKILTGDTSVPNSILMNTSNSRATFNAGTHIWYHASHGNISVWRGLNGADNFTISDVEALTNTKYCFAINPIACSPGAFDLGYSLAEAFVNTEHGAFATIQNARIGFADDLGSYDIQNQYYGREVFDAYFNESITRLGDMHVDAIHDCMWFLNPGNDPLNEAEYELHQKNLLGSPAVQMKFPTEPRHPPILSNEYPANDANNVKITQETVNVTIEDPTGDPFNWTIEGQYIINTSASGVSNGSKSAVLITPLPFNTLIIWYVNVTDGTYWTNKTFSFTTEPEQSLWWNNSWLYRKEIIINHTKVAANLNNFPVLIHITDADLASKAQSDGDDIVFTDCYRNRLNHEIELFENTTGKLIAWVNVPSLSSTTNTVLYIYYGNPSCTNQENPSGVWNSSFVMVQHLNETSGTCNDSTYHNNDGNPVGGLNQDAVGIIDGADSFNGVNSSYFVPDKGSLAGFTKGFTLSAWIKLNNNTLRQSFFGKWGTGSNTRAYLFEYQPLTVNGKCLLFVGTNVASGSPQTYTYSTFTPTVGVWYHVAAVWEPNQYAKLYVNGVLASVKEQSTYISSIYNNTLDPLFIGSYANNSRVLNGSMDEVRVTKIARSVGWLSTEYSNQQNPNTFYEIGSQELAPSENAWDVLLNFTGPNTEKDSVLFGEASTAFDGLDDLDVPKPGSPPAPYIYAWFDANLSEPYNKLWEDYRAYPDVNKTWDLNVRWENTGPDTVTIEWNPDNLTNSEYKSVILRDVDLAVDTDMLTIGQYSYLAADNVVHHFQVIATMIPSEVTYTVSSREEWNFVSFPVNESIGKSDVTVRYLGVNYSWQDAVNEGIIVNLIYGWSPSLKNYYVSDVFDPGAGFWLYAYDACNLSITTGTINDDTYISSLQQEWNLVGLPFSTPVNKQDLVVVHNGGEYSWQDAVSGGIVMNYVYGWSPSVKNYVMSDVLDPGTAYWMYAYQNCILKKGGS